MKNEQSFKHHNNAKRCQVHDITIFSNLNQHYRREIGQNGIIFALLTINYEHPLEQRRLDCITDLMQFFMTIFR